MRKISRFIFGAADLFSRQRLIFGAADLFSRQRLIFGAADLSSLHGSFLFLYGMDEQSYKFHTFRIYGGVFNIGDIVGFVE